MASKRALKKDIYYLYTDLLTECLTVSCFCDNVDEEQVQNLTEKIVSSCYDFIKRAGKTDGKDNKKVVKAYYKKLGQDMLQNILSLSQEIEKINSTK